MSGIDLSILVHEIKTYLDAKLVRQILRPVHLRKAAAIKAEVEKLLFSPPFNTPNYITESKNKFLH